MGDVPWGACGLWRRCCVNCIMLNTMQKTHLSSLVHNTLFFNNPFIWVGNAVGEGLKTLISHIESVIDPRRTGESRVCWSEGSEG